MAWFRFRPLTGALAFAGGICIAMSLAEAALAQDLVVPVTAEPNHRIRLDTGSVRIYEVQLSQGSSTSFHEHTKDSFSVLLNTTSRANEVRGGRRDIAQVKAGQVGFASTANGPYAHRIEATGDMPYRVVVIEMLSETKAVAATGIPGRPQPNFSTVLENSRGRAYRLVLKPGETSGTFTRPASTWIIAITGGRTSELTDGKAPRLWDSERGNFRWTTMAESLTLRNEGDSTIEFVEIEIH
jgi:hypothetical protein